MRVLGAPRERERERESTFGSPPRGVAIGNVTSQIFANVYLNELDRYVKHKLQVKHYLRYGDDFVIFANDREAAVAHREQVKAFLHEELCLDLHGRNDVIFPCRDGMKYLGCMLYPTHRRLQKRVSIRVLTRVDTRNVGSYAGLVHAHGDGEAVRRFHWETLRVIEGQSITPTDVRRASVETSSREKDPPEQMSMFG